MDQHAPTPAGGTSERLPHRNARSVPTTVAIVTAGASGLTLAWDQHKDLGPDGSLHGPYSTWQVVVLVLVLAASAAWGGLRGRPGSAAVAATGVLTLLWTVDAATDPPETNDGLWLLGALLVLVGTAVGTVVLAYLVHGIRSAWRRARSRAGGRAAERRPALSRRATGRPRPARPPRTGQA